MDSTRTRGPSHLFPDLLFIVYFEWKSGKRPIHKAYQVYNRYTMKDQKNVID